MRKSCYNRLYRRMVVDAETQSMIEGDVVVKDGEVIVKKLFNNVEEKNVR